eukprot:GHRQ01025827.1.p1 GENE.GHRQ01025827.1~~GHRQ01025827.1.p1  ORF type:complete len:161 (+),score=67.57 GHRQ01025827.1:372-854(+)
MSSRHLNDEHSKASSNGGARPAVTLRFRAAAANTAAAASTAAAGLPQELSNEALPPWEKVLWQRQPYPDNYVDESFLQHMVVNADVPVRDFWQVVLGSAAVSQQLSTVVAAVSVPVHLRLGLLHGHSLLLVNVLLLLVGAQLACCSWCTSHVALSCSSQQ